MKECNIVKGLRRLMLSTILVWCVGLFLSAVDVYAYTIKLTPQYDSYYVAGNGSDAPSSATVDLNFNGTNISTKIGSTLYYDYIVKMCCEDGLDLSTVSDIQEIVDLTANVTTSSGSEEVTVEVNGSEYTKVHKVTINNGSAAEFATYGINVTPRYSIEGAYPKSVTWGNNIYYVGESDLYISSTEASGLNEAFWADGQSEPDVKDGVGFKTAGTSRKIGTFSEDINVYTKYAPSIKSITVEAEPEVIEDFDGESKGFAVVNATVEASNKIYSAWATELFSEAIKWKIVNPKGCEGKYINDSDAYVAEVSGSSANIVVRATSSSGSVTATATITGQTVISGSTTIGFDKSGTKNTKYAEYEITEVGTNRKLATGTVYFSDEERGNNEFKLVELELGSSATVKIKKVGLINKDSETAAGTSTNIGTYIDGTAGDSEDSASVLKVAVDQYTIVAENLTGTTDLVKVAALKDKQDPDSFWANLIVRVAVKEASAVNKVSWIDKKKNGITVGYKLDLTKACQLTDENGKIISNGITKRGITWELADDDSEDRAELSGQIVKGVGTGEVVLIASTSSSATYDFQNIAKNYTLEMYVYPMPTLMYNSSARTLTGTVPNACATSYGDDNRITNVTGFRLRIKNAGDSVLYDSGEEFATFVGSASTSSSSSANAGSKSFTVTASDLETIITKNAGKFSGDAQGIKFEIIPMGKNAKNELKTADEEINADATATVYRVTAGGVNFGTAATYGLPGQSIKITASPASGFAFGQWSDKNKDNPRTVTVSNITANNVYTAEAVGAGSSTDANGVVYDANGNVVNGSGDGDSAGLDDVPKTSESNAPIWLIVVVLFAAMGGGYALYLQLRPATEVSGSADDEEDDERTF